MYVAEKQRGFVLHNRVEYKCAIKRAHALDIHPIVIKLKNGKHEVWIQNAS